MIISILLLTWEPPNAVPATTEKRRARRGIQSSTTKLRRSFSGYWAGPTDPRITTFLFRLSKLTAGPPGQRMPPEDSPNEYLEPSRQMVACGGYVPVRGPGLRAIARDPALEQPCGEQKNRPAPRGEHERWNVRVENPNRRAVPHPQPSREHSNVVNQGDIAVNGFDQGECGTDRAA